MHDATLTTSCYYVGVVEGYKYQRNLLSFYMDLYPSSNQSKVLKHATGVYSNSGFVFRQWKLTSDMRLFALKYGLPDVQAKRYETQFRDHAEICRSYWDEPAISDDLRQALITQNSMDYVVFGAAQSVWKTRWEALEKYFAEAVKKKQYYCSSHIKAASCGALGHIQCVLRKQLTVPKGQ